MRHPDPSFATTLAHGLALLQCFRVDAPTLSNKELSDATGLSKSTITRLTYTLMSRGLLAYDAHTRRYQLGPTALSLGYPLLAHLRVRQIARPLMQQLADFAEGSVSLGMRDRLNVVYIETSRGHESIEFRPDIGASLPILASAMGRAWLAAAPPGQRDDVIEAFAQGNRSLRTRARKVIATAVADLETKGFCVSHGDWQPDIHALAIPLRKPVDDEVVVLNCGVLTRRLKGEAIERRLGERLIETARRIEMAL
ncbi:MAG TPA: IclR family transcriptional regulator [Noviherbaspirillum sp.]|nr:IclR family transcriptional regulator [Noviherbaspirillum sp.]